MLKMTVKGIRQLQKDMGAETKKQKKALETAIKVEGFRQLRKLREDIRHGRPGGKPYEKELSEIARRTKSGRLRKVQVPLYRLARLLRYNVEYKNGSLGFRFGFVSSRSKSLSTSWKKLILKHHEGVDVLYTGSRTELGRRMARIGAKLEKKGDPDARFFFLRRSAGRRIDIPERPAIDMYWDSHDDEAKRNIAANFRRKMRGERI